MKMTLALFFGLAAAGFGEVAPVWFGTGGKDGIFKSMLDLESGRLSEPELAVETEGANFLARTKGGEVIYATGKNMVEAFRVKDGGMLEKFSSQSSEGKGPCMVSLDQTGKVLFVANYGSGSVASYPLGKDGAIDEAASVHQHEGSSVDEQRQKGPHAHSIYAGPENEFVYAADLGTDQVFIYKLDAEKGTLEPAGAGVVPPGSGPRHLKIVGDRVYVLNEMALTVSVFAREEGGGLKILGTYPVLAEGADDSEMSCSEILVTGDGRYAYTANRDLRKGGGRDSISVLELEKGGGLKVLESVSAEVWIPRNINLSPDGKWLLVAGQNSGEVSVFGVEKESGKLKFTGQKVKVPSVMRVLF